MESLQRIMEYIDHINSDISRSFDKHWLETEMRKMEKEVYKVINSQQEENQRLEQEILRIKETEETA